MNKNFCATYLVTHEVLSDGSVPREELIKQFEQTGKLPPKLLVSGVAIDTSVNSNRWAIHKDDLHELVASLRGADYRLDHSEHARDVIGKVLDAHTDGDKVFYKAETDEPDIIRKVLRGYLDKDSIQVDSDTVVCSVCEEMVRAGKKSKESLIASGQFYSRRDGNLVHLHKGAYEIVRHPVVRELSIVATPAYKTAKFTPLGFSAFANEFFQIPPEFKVEENIEVISQKEIIDGVEPIVKTASTDKKKIRGEENMADEKVVENAQPKPTSLQADVNTSDKVSAPSALDYSTFLQTLPKANIQDMIKPVLDPVVGDVKSLSQKYDELSTKIDALVKKLEVREAASTLAKAKSKAAAMKEEEEEEEDEDSSDESSSDDTTPVSKHEAARMKDETAHEDEDGDDTDETDETDETDDGAAASTHGKGKIAVSPSNDPSAWFKEIYKAHKSMPGYR